MSSCQNCTLLSVQNRNLAQQLHTQRGEIRKLEGTIKDLEASRDRYDASLAVITKCVSIPSTFSRQNLAPKMRPRIHSLANDYTCWAARAGRFCMRELCIAASWKAAHTPACGSAAVLSTSK